MNFFNFGKLEMDPALCSEQRSGTDIENTDFPDVNKINKTILCKRMEFEFSEHGIHVMLNYLNRCLNSSDWLNHPEVIQKLTETLKALRLYVTNEEVAAYIVKETSFYDTMNLLTQSLFTEKIGSELCTKYLLQFFLNLMSAGSDEQKKQVKCCIRKADFRLNFHLLFNHAYGHFYESSAVLYNLYSDTEITDIDFISHILLHHADQYKANEFLDFLLEKIIYHDFVWQNYEHLLLGSRLELLICLREMFIHCNLDRLVIKVESLPGKCLNCFIDMFNKCANVVFQVDQKENSSAIVEVSYILELLAHLSSKENYLHCIQNDRDIFINAAVLLMNIHRLGKSSSSNVFSPLQKLSEIASPSGHIKSNPVYGFKADLVRLIGNLCWHNRRMQDLAREGELIPVLLDCCNIDAKNPFIIQCVILAVRNICENNEENQKIIAGLTQQGVVNPEILQEFGLTLHAEEDMGIGVIDLAALSKNKTM